MRDYEPSDADIVRARLRTMGVQEHNLKFETGRHSQPKLDQFYVAAGFSHILRLWKSRLGQWHGVALVRRRRITYTGDITQMFYVKIPPTDSTFLHSTAYCMVPIL